MQAFKREGEEAEMAIAAAAVEKAKLEKLAEQAAKLEVADAKEVRISIHLMLTSSILFFWSAMKRKKICIKKNSCIYGINLRIGLLRIKRVQ